LQDLLEISVLKFWGQLSEGYSSKKKEKDHSSLMSLTFFNSLGRAELSRYQRNSNGYHWYESYAINACSSIE